MATEAPAAAAAAATAAAAADLDKASAKVEAMDIDEKKEEHSAPAAAPSIAAAPAEDAVDDPAAAAPAPSTFTSEVLNEADSAPDADVSMGDADAAAADDGNDKESTDSTDDLQIPDDLFDDNDEDKDTPPADPTEAILQAMTEKEEGNAAFKAGDYTRAVRSYRKGTTVLKPFNKSNTGDDQVKSLLVTLQTNLSMVCYKQDKHKMSRDVASKALEIDPANVKALYRRAVALRKLGDAESARADLRDALKAEPNNRAVRAELAGIKKEVEASRAKEKERLQKAFSQQGGPSFLYNDKEEEERRKSEEKKAREEAEAEALKKRKVEWEDECVKRMSNNEEAISFEDWEKEQKKKQEEEEEARKKAKKQEEDRKRAERQAAKAAAKKDEPEDSDDDELTEKEMAMMRGYKKTKDGRTTSYFSRDVPEEEMALLQQAAGPKLIGSASSTATPLPDGQVPSPSGNAAASAWNQAGTWEEKNTTEWCTSCLKEQLTSATVASLASLYSAKVTQVKDLTGDASVVLTRGRKRYVFDYHLSVQFDVIHVSEGVTAEDIDEEEPDEGKSPTETVVATGTLRLPDISSTVTIDELEIEPSSDWKKKPSESHSAGVLECRSALVEQIREKAQCFVTEFNSQY